MDIYHDSLEKMARAILDMKERASLKTIEEKIYQSKETLALIDKFQKAQEKYNDVLRFYENDNEKKQVCKQELIDAKKEMDKSPLVKEYNINYDIVSEPTLYLEKRLHEILMDGIKTC